MYESLARLGDNSGVVEGFTWKRDALGSKIALQPYTVKQYTFCFILAM